MCPMGKWESAEVGLAKLTSINNHSCCISHCLCGRCEVCHGLTSTSSLDVSFLFTGYANVGTMLVVSL
jgi:hypothetical protein